MTNGILSFAPSVLTFFTAKSLRRLAFLLFLILDQGTKWLADRLLAPQGSIELAPFLALTYTHNTGISFGLLQNVNNKILLLLNGALAGGLYFYWKQQEKKQIVPALTLWALMLIVAGAAGNIADRMLRGAVVDFIDIKIWPIFNIADSLISVGACLYFLSALKLKKQAKTNVS